MRPGCSPRGGSPRPSSARAARLRGERRAGPLLPETQAVFAIQSVRSFVVHTPALTPKKYLDASIAEADPEPRRSPVFWCGAPSVAAGLRRTARSSARPRAPGRRGAGTADRPAVPRRPPPAVAPTSELFSEGLPEDRLVERQIGDQRLQLPILLAELAQLPDLGPSPGPRTAASR